MSKDHRDQHPDHRRRRAPELDRPGDARRARADDRRAAGRAGSSATPTSTTSATTSTRTPPARSSCSDPGVGLEPPSRRYPPGPPMGRTTSPTRLTARSRDGGSEAMGTETPHPGWSRTRRHPCSSRPPDAGRRGALLDHQARHQDDRDAGARTDPHRRRPLGDRRVAAPTPRDRHCAQPRRGDELSERSCPSNMLH